MRRARIVVAGLLLCAVAGVSLAGRPLWPSGLDELGGGAVSINHSAARYAIVALNHGSKSLHETLVSQKWRPTSAAVPAPGPKRGLTIRSYAREGRLLYAVVPLAKEWAVLASFTDLPVWAGATGDAPGSDPLRLPRFGGARRTLHLVGTGFEAACYRSPMPSKAVLAEASHRLVASGWTLNSLTEAGLAVSRAGAPPVALFSEAEGTGSTLLVLVGTLPQ